jgi:hypothetical protein
MLILMNAHGLTIQPHPFQRPLVVSLPSPSMERGNGDRREPRGEVQNGETNGNRFLEALDRF